MAVSDIKEYVDSKIEILNNTIKSHEEEKSSRTKRTNKTISIALEMVKDFKYELKNIRSMLDELEDRPKAKWIKTSLSYYDDDYGYECSNCKEIYCTDYDFEEMQYNYCPNCGARMDDEVDDEPKN